MRRHILGALALVLLLGAVVIWRWWPNAELEMACCWRGGAILAAAWLAYEDVQRLPNWLLVTLPVVLIVLVRVPRMLPLLAGAIVVWAVVRRFLAPADGRGRG
jgi:hypothetical protein